MIDTARIVGLPTLSQDLRLADPFLLLDPGSDTQGGGKPLDVGRRQPGDIAQAADAQLLQAPPHPLVDAMDAGQILAGTDAALLDLGRRARAA